MKNLFPAIMISLLVAGCSQSDGNHYTAPLKNHDGEVVTEFEFTDGELAGQWKAVGDAIAATWPNGEPLSINFDREFLQESVIWYYAFENDGEGSGHETLLGRKPEYSDPYEYDFTWELSGNRLELNQLDELPHRLAYGMDDEWTITELTSDKLVLYRRTPYTFAKQDDSFFHVWYIFERVVEEY